MSPFQEFPYPASGDPAAIFRWAREVAQQMRLVQITAVAETGTVQSFVGLTTPAGWLECDGRVLSTEDFPALWRVIGNKWNTGGEAVGTFRLPNGRGKTFIASEDNYGGEEELVLTQANLPNVNLSVTDPGHVHTFNSTNHTHTVNEQPHQHTFSQSVMIPGGTIGVDAGGVSAQIGAGGAVLAQLTKTNLTVNSAQAGGTIASASTGISVALGGDGEAVSMLPPFFGGSWIIKT
jgi:microcystin-dependent protein